MPEEGFDFGSLGQQQKKFGKMETQPDIIIELKREISDMRKMLDKKLTSTLEQSGALMDGKISHMEGRIKKFKDELQASVEIYEKNITEIWSEIYPTLVKMWGTGGKFSRKIAELDLLIHRKEKDEAESE